MQEAKAVPQRSVPEFKLGLVGLGITRVKVLCPCSSDDDTRRSFQVPLSACVGLGREMGSVEESNRIPVTPVTRSILVRSGSG
jgi:hypothetical protein